MRIQKLLGLSIIALILALSVPFQSYALSYRTNFWIYDETTGVSRTYEGKSIIFDVKSVSCRDAGSFAVTLYRDVNWGIDDKIGVAYFDRNTPSSAKWSNVGAGRYYVKVTRVLNHNRVSDGLDDSIINADNVVIYDTNN